jgi:hypothetical protein
MNDTPPTTTRPAPTEKQREVSTVLAALRYWQEYTSTTERNYDPHFTNDDGEPIIAPLTDAEIDALCVRVKRHLA